MPAFDSQICTGRFVQQVLGGIVWLPRTEQIKTKTMFVKQTPAQLRENLVANLTEQIEREPQKTKVPMANLVDHMKTRFPDVAWMQAIAATLDFEGTNPIFQAPQVRVQPQLNAFGGAGDKAGGHMMMLPAEVVQAFK
jgi:hypothetical protein